MVDFKATTQGSKGTLAIIYSNGDTKTLQSTHPAYAEVLTYFATHPDASTHDEEFLREISNPAVRLGRALKAVDPRFDFDMFTLSFDGFPLTGPLADLIKDRLANGKTDWERFAKFAARLEANPSFTAKQALYTFVQGNGLTILADGRFVGHKAIKPDGFSVSAGPNNIVNGEVYKRGEVTRVPHAVGSVISKRRGDVDDSRVACSTGLHVGSLDYARTFSRPNVLVTVAVPPEDIVGGEFASKIRTASYEVVGFNETGEDFVEGYEIVDRSDVLGEQEKAFAVKASPLSRDHNFTEEERAQYNSLPSVGRTLYDSLRTLLNKSHRLAYETALADFGTYDEWLARRDAERAEQAAAAAQAAAEEQARLEAGWDDLVDPVDVQIGTSEEPTPADLAALSTMEEKAEASAALKADLLTPTIGHKPLARKWERAGVTESSVRRWRKGKVEVSTWAKVKDALS